jgi:hypothetical protein
LLERNSSPISNSLAVDKRHMTPQDLSGDFDVRGGLTKLKFNPGTRQQTAVGLNQGSSG